MEWISVKDKLPELNIPILIYDEGIGIGFRSSKNRFHGLDMYKYEHKPTHWMPLPEPPKTY